MSRVTNRILLQELRRTDALTVRLCKAVEETLAMAKAAVRDLEEGSLRISKIKKKYGFDRSATDD